MDHFSAHLNDLLVDTFWTILKVEEATLKGHDETSDLSINEMHLIESVGEKEEGGRTISEIAEDLGITLPSVTVGINKLHAKGYVEKVRGETDSRTVFVKLTKKGQRVDAVHRYFHEKMVRSVTKEMTEDEKNALIKGIVKLNAFFKGKLKAAEE